MPSRENIRMANPRRCPEGAPPLYPPWRARYQVRNDHGAWVAPSSAAAASEAARSDGRRFRRRRRSPSPCYVARSTRFAAALSAHDGATRNCTSSTNRGVGQFVKYFNTHEVPNKALEIASPSALFPDLSHAPIRSLRCKPLCRPFSSCCRRPPPSSCHLRPRSRGRPSPAQRALLVWWLR